MIKKPILLPSRGVGTKDGRSIIHLSQIKYGDLLFLNDPFFAKSDIESIIATLTACDVEDVENMLFQDAYCAWLISVIDAGEMTSIKHSSNCTSCGKIDRITIPLEKLSIDYLDRTRGFIEDKISLNKTNLNNQVVIKRRARTVADVMNFCIKMLEITSDKTKTDIDLMREFCSPVIVEFSSSDNKMIEPATPETISSFFSYLAIEDLIEYFHKTRKEDFGVTNKLKYSCTQCGQEHDVFISDPFRASITYSNSAVPWSDKYSEMVESAVTLSSTKYVKMEEVLNFPFKTISMLTKAIDKSVKRHNDAMGGKNTVRAYEDSALMRQQRGE